MKSPKLNQTGYFDQIIIYLGLIIIALMSGGCIGQEPSTPVAETVERITPTTKNTPEGHIPTLSFTAIPTVSIEKTTPTVQIATTGGQIGIIRHKDEIDPNFVNFQLNYFTGGAGRCYSYGQAEICKRADNGPISLYISGVYSTADQEDYYDFPFCWVEKSTPCKSTLELGDMIYFMARGFELGEKVKFTIEGPKGEERYFSTVNREILKNPSCQVDDKYEAARFSWVATPELDIGDYKLTVSGRSGSVSIRFSISYNDRPNFGVLFGIDGHPLLLQKGEKIKLSFVGFSPGKTVTTLIYKDPISITDVSRYDSEIRENSELVRFIDTIVNERGMASKEIDWKDDLESGIYSLVVPEFTNSCGSLESSIQFMFQDESNPITEPPGYYQVVNVSSNDVLNIRSGPGVDNQKAGIIAYNTQGIMVIGSGVTVGNSVWVPIKFGNAEGWVNSHYLSPVPLPGSPEYYKVVNVSSDDVLNIRSGPGANYQKVGIIPYNANGVIVTGSGVSVGNSVWVPINFYNTEGWVNRRYLSPEH